MKPLTIIGGGLAGLSLGNALLRQGIPITLHERGSYPKHRVCGEFISGVSEDTLRQLHLHPHLEKATSIETISWFIKNQRLLHSPLEENAYGLSRHQLDLSLAIEFQKLGGQLHTQSKITDAHAINHAIKNEATIWTTGKPSNTGGSWIALSIHLENTDIQELEMHSGPSGYIGLSPIEDGKTNVTGLFKKNKHCKGKHLDLILAYLRANQLTQLAARLKNFPLIEDSFCAISGFEFGQCHTAHDPNRLQLGDAAQLIPPFVGNGMSMALESAAIAADHLTNYAKSPQKSNWQQTVSTIQNDCAKLFHTRMKVALHLHPLLLSKIGLNTLSLSSKLRLLPLKTLYRLTR